MRKIKLPVQTEITTDIIDYVLKQHSNEASRITKMKQYYDARNAILLREFSDKDKPNNKLPHPYPAYITNMAVGHAFGIPVAYECEKENFKEVLDTINGYNDEQDHNTDLALWQSISGYGIELIYADEEARYRYTSTNPATVAVVYDMTIQENIQFAIRYFDLPNMGDKDKKSVQIEVLEKDKITTYIKQEDKYTLLEEATTEHSFGDVPVSVYANNTDMIGDFEKVIPLCDAYDKTESDTANDFEYFTDAYLLLIGDYIESEDAKELRQKRMINLPNKDSNAMFLTKNINDAALENYKSRLDKDIHKFSFMPDIASANFTSNLSGESLKYKFAGLNNICKTKHSKFKKGLMRRLELMFNFLEVLSETEYTKIEPVFTLNMPKNDIENTQVALQKITTQAMSRKAYLVDTEGYTEEQADKVLEQMQLEARMLEEGYGLDDTEVDEIEEGEDDVQND